MKQFLILSTLAFATVGCGSTSPAREPAVNFNRGGWVSRLWSGDKPATPNDANDALKEITADVKSKEVAPREWCHRNGGATVAECENAETARTELAAMQKVFRTRIDSWRLAGGESNTAATKAFHDALDRDRPNLLRWLDVLGSWEQPIEPSDGPIVPGTGR